MRGVAEHRARIDELLSTYSEGWSLDRMPGVDRNVLRIGVFEVLYVDDVPDAVAVSEAVNLVRDLSTDESPAFVNGVLGGHRARQGLARRLTAAASRRTPCSLPARRRPPSPSGSAPRRPRHRVEELLLSRAWTRCGPWSARAPGAGGRCPARSSRRGRRDRSGNGRLGAPCAGPRS